MCLIAFALRALRFSFFTCLIYLPFLCTLHGFIFLRALRTFIFLGTLRALSAWGY